MWNDEGLVATTPDGDTLRLADLARFEPLTSGAALARIGCRPPRRRHAACPRAGGRAWNGWRSDEDSVAES
jgi:hypothetical protein